MNFLEELQPVERLENVRRGVYGWITVVERIKVDR